MKKLIEVKKLRKVYKDGGDEVVALDDVSFSLKEAEDLAIIGSSGSGKTTLLELVGGLNQPTSGEVWIDGVNVAKYSDRELSTFRNKEIGFIFQMIHLQDYLSATENVMIPMLVAGTNLTEARKKAEGLLDLVGLSHRLNHRPSQLSGGETQRVAIARALGNDPKILMADEPTGKLDKENSKMVMDLMEKISKEKGISVIVITHDPDIAKRFGRVITLRHGKVESDVETK